MPQILLFPDPRPLVDRLGVDFFQQAPESPGVYLMKDAANTVLYVGKAKNLRKRLGSYRVANPDRLARRQLRLLRAVARIELQECEDESAALARESELLRQLRPRFNRAGTWPGPPRFLAWRMNELRLEMAVLPGAEPGWVFCGPIGAGAFPLRDCLARLCWCSLHPSRGIAEMPAGWFQGQPGAVVTIPVPATKPLVAQELKTRLTSLFAGNTDQFDDWVRQLAAPQQHPFESTARDADLETLREFTRWPDRRLKLSENHR